MTTFKRGQKVQWDSHAGGQWKTKTGRIIEVCRTPRVNVTQQTAIQILREAEDITIAKAKEKARFINTHSLLQTKYKLKFNPVEGTRDETPHYLVEVDRGPGRKPFLYHPLNQHLTPAG